MKRHLILMSLFGFGLLGCQQTVSEKKQLTPIQPRALVPQAVEPKPLLKTQQAKSVSLKKAILEHSDADLKAVLMEQANRLNEGGAGETKLTYFQLIAATRSLEVLKLAVELGGDIHQKISGSDLETFVLMANLKQTLKAEPKQTGLYFSFAGSGKPNTQTMTAAGANRLIEKLAYLKALQFQQNTERKVAKNHQAWLKTVQTKKAELSQPIAEIPQPTLPPIEKHQKSPFESLAMFQARMDDSKRQRQQQTEAIIADYRQKVEARNHQLQQNAKALAALKKEFESKQAEFEKAIAKEEQTIARQAQDKQPEFLIDAMAKVYGQPYLTAVMLNGQPKYDAEKGLMYAHLHFANLKEPQQIVMPVPPGPLAEQVFNQLKAKTLDAKVVYKFKSQYSREVEFVRVDAQPKQGDKLIAKLEQNDGFILPKTVEVVLQEKTALPALQQGQMQQVVFDESALENLQLQNPNIKDVQYEAFVLQQQKAFNDDVPQLFAQAKAAPIDRKKWLFVVGIGQYEQTDDILYSKRSAEWFAKTAAKTLGIQKGRQVVLLDKQASSGAIKDQLKLMLSKVQKGDEIIFYYSGHGLPVVEKGNAPYLLPADKIPDFIADDDFYQAKNIYRQLMNSQADSVVAFMDSCFTGQTDGNSVFGGAKAATRLQPKSFKPDSHGKMAILTAGNEKQFSNAYGEKGHRLFSYYLIKAMLKGYDQVGDLATKVKAEVNDTSLDMGGLNRQTPVLTGNPKLKL